MRRAWPVALVAFSCVAFAQEAPSPAPGPQAAPIDGDIPGESADAPPSAPTGAETGEAEAAAMPEGMRSGRDIYQAFRDGLAEPACGSGTTRYEQHFRHAPARLADPDSDVLPLFGHVVDALRQAHLPTEYALIPFVESGYAPGARSASGPAGLWQFVSHTARHHGVPVHKDYDGRLSPAESTRAAVEYLRKLNGMLGGNWRLTAMAYNAGESRVLQALRRSGNVALEATPGSLQGLSPITYAYVDKLHALACVLSRAGDEPEWMDRLDRPVLALEARQLEGASKLDTWALGNGQDAAVLRRLNPALAQRWTTAPLALVPAITPPPATALDAVRATAASADADAGATPAPATGRVHVVRRGESVWAIARRHGVAVRRLLELNDLAADSVLRPGMKLRID
ncbi:lytic transglycosylase domain-containing protein [Pseudoxanthomonas suwonensis]|uniref:lytic transglycosylase domain-containing protein n=1 Tax=Pseudoxanthomonas suwonensis TaxID=314722 RepID=UPI00138F3EC8|nr:lytic transglycosylase domain-containing protein [Pseudoxanthomonas suwonensis]KAF1702547.1 lytic transglycosylase [Pseudoxanthomonas suwonensis]